MAKNYNTRHIRSKYSYSLQEIATLYHININTVRRWRRDEGLKTVTGCYPYLVKGYDLKEFIINRQAARKTKLAEGELYCVKCRKGVKPVNDETTITQGFIISGVCPECGSNIYRFKQKTE